jgi:hypothetical protein
MKCLICGAECEEWIASHFVFESRRGALFVLPVPLCLECTTDPVKVQLVGEAIAAELNERRLKELIR